MLKILPRCRGAGEVDVRDAPTAGIMGACPARRVGEGEGMGFIASAIAVVLLIAPSAHQRLRAPQTGVKRHSRVHLLFTVRMTIVGTVAFAVALASAVYLVTALFLEQRAAAVGTSLIAALVAWAWFYVPLVRFSRE